MIGRIFYLLNINNKDKASKPDKIKKRIKERIVGRLNSFFNSYKKENFLVVLCLIIQSLYQPLKTYRKINDSDGLVVTKSLVLFFAITCLLSYVAAVGLAASGTITQSQIFDVSLIAPLAIPLLFVVSSYYFSMIGSTLKANEGPRNQIRLMCWSLNPLLLVLILTSLVMYILIAFFEIDLGQSALNKFMASVLLFYTIISMSISHKISIVRSAFIITVSISSFWLLYLITSK